jgi:hypothetical protein
MSRRIQTAASTQAQAPIELNDGSLLLGAATLIEDASKTSADAAAPDNYIARLAKYIPAEIIALYLGVANVIPVTDSSYHLALWIVAGTTALCTPVYMYLATREAGKPTLWSQIVISSIAFPIWVFAIGGPFAFLPWYAGKHWIAAIVISFVTFLAGAYQPGPAPPAKEATAR